MPFPNPSTQWKPGQTGNPHGRPRKGIVTDAAEDFLMQPHPKHEGKTRAEVIAIKWLERAENDPDERDKLLDRVEGKQADRLEAEVNNSGRVVILPPKSDEGPAGAPDAVPGDDG